MNMKGIGGHQSAVAGKHEWLTPPDLLRKLGVFDLDPCAPVVRPWDIAMHHFTINDDGLLQEWFGRVWLNPPYGKFITAWLNRMAMHNNGIALTFGRTDTNFFHQYIFNAADSILFIKQRLTFFGVDGKTAAHNGGAPSVLIGYGRNNTDALAASGIHGKLILMNRAHVIIISFDKTWKVIVQTALVNLSNEADLQTIYSMVENIAPEKTANNKFYKEKVRQTLQLHFTNIKKGRWAA